jgi:hypothetical protein
MKEQIRVKIKKDGSVVVSGSGFAGKSCVEATEGLELFLGQQKKDREFTADYYKPEPKPESPWITRQ